VGEYEYGDDDTGMRSRGMSVRSGGSKAAEVRGYGRCKIEGF
jgi:hypothetical protein